MESGTKKNRRRIFTEEDLQEAKELTTEELEQGSEYTSTSYFDEANDPNWNKWVNRIHEKLIPTGPWGIQNSIIDDPPKLEELITLLRHMSKKHLEKAACCAIIYLSGARVGEILGSKFEDGTIWPGIKWKDIESEDRGDSILMKIRTLREKARVNRNKLKDGRNYQFTFRTVPVVLYNNITKFDDTKIDYWPLIDIVQKYQSSLGLIKPDDLIFPKLKEDTFRRFLRRTYKINVHIFRHWRASHLAYYHNLSESELRKVIGWERGSNMPSRYLIVSDRAIEEKLSKIDKVSEL